MKPHKSWVHDSEKTLSGTVKFYGSQPWMSDREQAKKFRERNGVQSATFTSSTPRLVRKGHKIVLAAAKPAKVLVVYINRSK